MKLKYLYIWLIGLLAIGCFDDDTTVDTVRISEVAIDTNSLQKEYNRDKNQTLVIDITSYVTQKEKDLPLTFQWDMDYKFGFIGFVRGLSGVRYFSDAGKGK